MKRYYLLHQRRMNRRSPDWTTVDTETASTETQYQTEQKKSTPELEKTSRNSETKRLT